MWNSFQHYQAAFCKAASAPPCHEKAKSRVRRPDLFWVDVGVMPAMRPEAISNRVRLSNEVRAAMRRLVAEDCAVDAQLAFSGALVNTVVDELAPDEAGVTSLGSEHDLFTWSNKQFSPSPVFVLIGRVVSFIQFKAVFVAIFGEPPEGCLHADSTRNSVPAS